MSEQQTTFYKATTTVTTTVDGKSATTTSTQSYVQSSGRKKALMIGINYYGTPYELKGCINDVANIKAFLKQHGYEESNIRVLTDDQLDTTKIPTRQNMIEGLKWLVSDAQPGDSGHGGQLLDTDNDEDDYYDETIMPLDFPTAGHIIDDVRNEQNSSTTIAGGQVFNNQLLFIYQIASISNNSIKYIITGVRMTVIFDSCHSGTALDLPYTYSTKGIVKDPGILKAGGSALFYAGISYLQGDLKVAKDNIHSFTKKAKDGKVISQRNKANKSSKADVIMLSGCKDLQTSADAFEAGKSTGAMSFALISTVKQKYPLTYQELLNSVRDILAEKYLQKPQLSASHEIDIDGTFTF
ncbi:4540_t:CDS:2 [Paraglomus brasilianum]|uniref:4540_t:CDS:1 n=1 Tax=Paraglomus brasilianum TaxID=144538 RepID=A0A9N8VF24_9GLOM|nr:4540_t:CDS:2 [Paraglomus brasilianum]